jgi:hypothetical protein
LGNLGGNISALFCIVLKCFELFSSSGNAIGDSVEKPAFKYFLPMAEKILPADFKKWARPLISFIIKSIAVSIAWMLQRMISLVHSAIRGGLLFSRNILTYCNQMGYTKIDQEGTYMDEIVGFGVAAVGLAWQLTRYSLPLPLQILLFPFFIVNFMLEWFVHEVR